MTSADDFAEILRESRDSPIAIFHDYRVRRNSDGAAHLFFEGKDDHRFYSHFIREFDLEKRPTIKFNCRGRNNVVGVFRLIKKHNYEDAVNLFFVDRDIVDPIPTDFGEDPATFVTCFYSFENYMPYWNVMKIFLIDVAGIDENAQRFAECKEWARIKFATLRTLMMPIMALYHAALTKGAPRFLSGVSLTRLVEITATGKALRRKEAISALRDILLENGIELDIFEIITSMRILREQETKLWLRGKYEYRFFILMLKFSIPYFFSERVPASIASTDGLDVVSRLIPCPIQLKDFLIANLQVQPAAAN